jgi:hypothetical protein
MNNTEISEYLNTTFYLYKDEVTFESFSSFILGLVFLNMIFIYINVILMFLFLVLKYILITILDLLRLFIELLLELLEYE